MNALTPEARPIFHCLDDCRLAAFPLNPLPRRLQEGFEGHTRIAGRVIKPVAVKVNVQAGVWAKS
jgi:hypothetical protein